MITSANFATHPAPKRAEALRQSVESIINQVDVVRIYWNNYHFEDIPDWAKTGDKIENLFGRDLTDNGKFASLNEWTEEYYFSCDDKILYPSDYVEVMKTYLLVSDIATAHGRKLVTDGNYLSSYYMGGHMVYDYRLEIGIFPLNHIQIPGTGVMAINTTRYNPFEIKIDKRHRMTDLLIGLEAAKMDRDILLVPHKEGWLKSIQMPTSICSESQQTKQTEQIEIVKQIVKLKEI